MKYNYDITQSELCESPREWDNVTDMVCFHGRYDLGDETDLYSDMFDGWDELEHHLINECNAVVLLPIYMYDHSGIGISTDNNHYPFNCPWDAGQVGFIYITKETAMREYGYKTPLSSENAKHLTDVLISDVELYNQYLSGDVYDVTIRDENDEITDHIGEVYGYSEAEKEGEWAIKFQQNA